MIELSKMRRMMHIGFRLISPESMLSLLTPGITFSRKAD